MVFRQSNGSVKIELDTQRLDTNIKEAHKKLNMLIVADSTPYIPFQQGQLRSQVRYPDGIYGDTIEWYAPYAHYQYEGVVYTDAQGRTFVKAGETKPVNTGRPLNYSEPDTGAKWFERAKSTHMSEWIKKVEQVAGGKANA